MEINILEVAGVITAGGVAVGGLVGWIWKHFSEEVKGVETRAKDVLELIQGKFKETKERVDDVEEKEATEHALFLTEKNHSLLCKNAHLELEKHITKELINLKDATLVYLRGLDIKIDKVLKNGNHNQGGK